MDDRGCNCRIVDRRRVTIHPEADYVAAKLKDAGPVTQEECLEFFGGVGAACD